MRQCKYCGQEKPIARFVINRECVLGYGYRCKDCKNEYQQKKRLERRLKKMGLKKNTIEPDKLEQIRKEALAYADKELENL